MTKENTPVYGTAGDWSAVCQSADAAEPDGAAAARAWFEANLEPFSASNHGRRDGLFTGYYEPELQASLVHEGPYQTPLLRRPADLVSVNLGDFRPDLKGRRIAGRVAGGRLVPFATRGEITSGALDTKKLALAWVKNPVDAFFLQIQGSGRLDLPGGSVLRVGYDGQNGWPYTAIGRVLREIGALDPKAISMQTIRAWLESHPGEAQSIMDKNASYVFFKKLKVTDPSLGPPGAEGVPLTPGVSLAVDRKFHALGVPIWLDTTLPTDEAGTPGEAFRRLMIAQDTGGAIRGPVRGDVFFGFGTKATELAGRMKQKGRFFVLLPNVLAARQAQE
jgi:membrane-bound lytic murein transglycosylase A